MFCAGQILDSGPSEPPQAAGLIMVLASGTSRAKKQSSSPLNGSMRNMIAGIFYSGAWKTDFLKQRWLVCLLGPEQEHAQIPFLENTKVNTDNTKTNEEHKENVNDSVQDSLALKAARSRQKDAGTGVANWEQVARR